MDHCGLGVFLQDSVLLLFDAGKQEQEEVMNDQVADWWVGDACCQLGLFHVCLCTIFLFSSTFLNIIGLEFDRWYR